MNVEGVEEDEEGFAVVLAQPRFEEGKGRRKTLLILDVVLVAPCETEAPGDVASSREARRPVAGFAKDLRQGCETPPRVGCEPRLIEGPMGGLGRGRGRNRPVEDDALARQGVEMRAGVPRVSVEAEMIGAKGIEGNQDDVGGALLSLLAAADGEERCRDRGDARDERMSARTNAPEPGLELHGAGS